MKRILCAVLCAAMLCSVIVSGTGAADETFGQKSDSAILYDEALGYYKGVAEKTSADAFAAEFTSSVEVKNPAGETVAGDTFVGSDFSVIDGTVSRKILVYGDVNRDGVINLKDVSAMIRKSAGMSVDLCEAAFDVTLDGTNNMKDIGRVIRSLAGWDVELGYIPWTLDLEPVIAPAEDAALELYFTDSTVREGPEVSVPNGVYSYQMFVARNEAEQCHANLYSLVGHEGLNATLTDFTDKYGNTLETTFLWEQYMTVKQTKEVSPDKLLPMENDFSVKNNTAQGLFIKVKADADDEAGLYRAVLQITDADNNVIKKAYVYTEVWDFTLPEASSAKTAFGLSAYNVYLFHSVTDDPDRELYTKYYEYLLGNRMNAWCMPFDPITDEANEYMSDPRVNTFLVAGGYSGDIYGGNKTAEEIAEAYEKLSQNEEWASKALFYMNDEPLVGDNLSAVISTKEFLDTCYPNARNIVPQHVNWFDDETQHSMSNHEAGCAFDAENKYPQFDGKDTFQIVAENTQVLCPCARLFPTPDVSIEGVLNWYTQRSTDTYGTMVERLAEWREKGREIWWYTANSPRHPMCNISIQNTGIENRLLFWQQYKYDIDGFLYWATNENEAGRNTVDGESGILVYSGKRYGIDGPVPCLRAEIVRDSIEDFEYLTMIEKFLGRTEAEKYMANVVTDVNNFTRDEAVLNEARREMGELLVQLNRK